MQFQDKLFLLRKRQGMTQAELSEAINVSRQAISKWEMGTAVPDVSNMLALSKVFHVSVDYLVNDEMENESDAPVVRATAAVFKINYQYILLRVIVAIGIAAVVAIVGIISHSFASMIICLLIIGFIFLLHSVFRLLMLFFSNRRH
ncbi:helix-turn-helix transcriptional regulator [[Clostridium] symbiosum]|uniref:helix-turn-helix domain-containing protein n=1 Tax=Clostridium symbiosum TaxID=1512 RepID=UPI003312FB79